MGDGGWRRVGFWGAPERSQLAWVWRDPSVRTIFRVQWMRENENAEFTVEM